MTTPSKSTIIGRYQNDTQRNDFLQLENRDGGLVFGGIDGAGYRYGTLAAGNIQGVLVKTADYQITVADNGQLISVNSAGTVNLTLPVIAPDFPWFIQVESVGAGTVIIHSTPTIDGSVSTVSLSQNQGLLIVSNGSAYYTQRGVGGSGGTGFSGVSAQTGDYTAQPTDSGKLLTFSKATAVTLTLPASAPGSEWFLYVQNRGAGVLTINRNGLNIDGAAGNLTLLQNQGEMIFCDGSNYFTSRGVSGIGAVNSQVNDYTILPADAGKLVTVSKVTAVTVTLPATSPGPAFFVMIQNVGAGTLTVARNGRTIDGASSNLTLTTNQGVIIYTDGTNYFTERGTGTTASNVAIKPASTDGIQYVTLEGDDANDGLSWGTAKLHIMAAYDALAADGGTIRIASGTTGNGPRPTATATEGIWLLGASDPNFASPPTGWRQIKTGAVTFEGYTATDDGGVSIVEGMTSIGTPSSNSGTGNPAIWLSGVSGVTFKNLNLQYPARAIRIGINSNGVKDGAIANANVVFQNIRCSLDQVAASGPTVEIGPNVLWLLFRNMIVSANGAATVDTDNRCAFVSDSNGQAGNLIYFQDIFMAGGGGIRWYADANSSEGFRARNLFMEGLGTDTQPLVDVIGSNQAFISDIDLNGGGIADGIGIPAINVDSRMRPSQVVVRGASATESIGLNGPLTVFGSFPSTDTNTNVQVNGIPVANVSPASKNQHGTFFGIVTDQVDNERRSFGPSIVRYTNNLGANSQLPATWTDGRGTTTITPGITALDGTANAGRLTSVLDDSGISSVYFFDRSITFTAGDYVYFGYWTRPASGAGFKVQAGITSSAAIVQFQSNQPFLRAISSSSVDRMAPPGISQNTGMGVPVSYYQTDGGWQWIWGLFKVTKTGTGASTQFAACFDVAHPVDAFAPVFVQVPASTFAIVVASTIDTVGNSGATESGHIVTIKTTGAHNLFPGMPVIISGVTAAGYNGEFVVRSTPTSATFTYYNATTGLGTSGSGSVVTQNDTEAVEWARMLKSYPDGLTAGPTVATLRGERLAFGGTGDNFFTILDHTALTQNRTLTVPDGDGPIVLASAPNAYSAAQQYNAGLRIGSGGTLLTQTVVYTPTLTPSAVSANSVEEQDFAVSGLTTADVVVVNQPTPTANVGVAGWRVKSNAVLSIQFVNPTGSPVTPASGIYKIIAFRS